LKLFAFAWGKPKFEFWKEAEAHYIRSIGHMTDLQFIQLKEGEDNSEKETKQLLDALEKHRLLESGARVFLLDERGKSWTSQEWATETEKLADQGVQRVAYCVGSAYGFAPDLKAQFPLISLSKLTLPHDMARIVLLEQIYRSLHIQRGGKYHHGGERK
jgi:23S rRNA (pseudouridine1915-N3)-methyltransferase